jgi:putative transposase
MRKYWEFVRKNVFSELLSLLGKMNSYAESWVGTIKRECLSHFIVFGELHLRYLISEYVKYYNTIRPHSSMDNMPLELIPDKDKGQVKCQSKLGGVIKHYYRE